MNPDPLRGTVWFAELSIGRKPVVVVSNNGRNQALPTVLAARITTAPKPHLDSIVELPGGESLVGRVLCDEISTIHRTRLIRYVGGLSIFAMRRLDDGLRAALALQA